MIKIGNIECYGIIYKITNIVNGKVYIGQTIKERGFNGRYDYGGVGVERVLKYYKFGKRKSYLYNSILKYGTKSFIVDEIFDIAFSKAELDLKEKSWIKIYNSNTRNFGYNIMDGGSNGVPNEDARKRNSESKKGRFLKNENPNSKKVICLTTGELFECILDGANKYKTCRTGVTQSCNGTRKSAGKHPITGEKLVWMFYDEYINDKDEVSRRLKSDYSKNKRITKKVICITTGDIFDSIKDATEYIGHKNTANITSCCRGRLDFCGVLEDGTKLVWRYYNDLK